MKIPVLTSLKTKLIFWMSIFVLGVSAAITFVSYRFMFNAISENYMRTVAQAADTRHRLLVNVLEFKRNHARSLLSHLSKTCLLTTHVNHRDSQRGAQRATPNGSSKKTKIKFDEMCIRYMLEGFADTEMILGLVVQTFDHSQEWTAGDMDVSSIEKLDFEDSRQWAIFQDRTFENVGRPFFIQVVDPSVRLKLTIQYPLREITEIFSHHEELGVSGETFLADGEGNFITSPRYPLFHFEQTSTFSQKENMENAEPARAHPSLARLILQQPRHLEGMKLCLQNKNTELLGKDYRGEKIIQGFHYVPEIGGGCIMAHIRQNEVFASLGELKTNIIALVFVFSVMALVIVYMFSAQLFKPLIYLTSVAQKIAGGNYNQRSQLKRDDEIGLLSDAFNKMTNSIFESERKFIMAVENIKDYAITLLDREGRIAYWNRGIENVFGWSESEAVGRPYGCYFTDEDNKLRIPEKKLAQVRERGSAESEGLRRRADGSTFVASSQCSAIYDKNKNLSGYILITRDISEKKELEATAIEALRESSQKSSFIASMSHEIRTPLNSLIGVIQILKERIRNKDEERLLNVAHGAGESLLTVINDILDISKIEAGEVRLDKTSFHLEDLIGLCRDIMKIRARDKNIEIKIQMDPRLSMAYHGDANRIRQIFLNLLGNAIKFSEKGEINIRVSLKSRQTAEREGYLPVIADANAFDPMDQLDEIHVAVSDQGIGIPPHLKEVIFERFKQADESITRRYGGTGLGLSICKNLVELMGGRIWVESEVGVGSTFHFTLSLRQSHNGIESLDESRQVGGAELSRLVSGDFFREALKKQGKKTFKILLADDAEENRMIFSSLLKKQPFEITLVKNGEEAVKAVKANNYDAIFMDVQMPILDGYSATREIRQWEKQFKLRSHIPIVALTANALDEDFRMSLSMGCDDHLCKPINKEKLLRMTETYLVHFFDIPRIRPS